MKRIRKDNRGAALITAVITIMFIAILGTTLLSVSYSNLIMKKNNVRAKDNTYTAEMAMGELQSVLRSKDDLDGVKSLLGDATKVNRTTKTFSASTFYPMAASEANSSDDQVVITYDSLDDSSIPNTIILRGVTASSVVDGFEANVKTDITITASSGGRYNLDINDFSILCDQDFSMDDETQMRATNSHVYGYLYCGRKSATDSTAMQLRANSTLNIISEAAIINGDVVLKDDSVLHILGGTCIITGSVKLSGNATLIVSSECKISGNIQTSGSSRVVGSANITTNTGLSVNSALEDGTVTKGLYRDFSIWNSGGTSQYQNLNVGKNLYREQFDKEVSTSIGGTNYKARLFLHKLDSGQTFNGFTNTLFISSAKIKVQSGNYFNSTVITPGRVLMAVQKQYVTTQMDPNVYQQLRQLDVPAIKLADATNIDNPKKYIPGTSYSASPNLKFDDILYPRDTTSNFLSNLFNVANPGGGSKKTSVKVSNWRVNEYD